MTKGHHEFPDAEQHLRAIADMVKRLLPPGFGFGLFMFEFGDGEQMAWISNANRQDMKKALLEWIEKEQPNE